MRTVLASAHRARDEGDAAAARLDADVARLSASADGREGVASFVERREARVTGR